MLREVSIGGAVSLKKKAREEKQNYFLIAPYRINYFRCIFTA